MDFGVTRCDAVRNDHEEEIQQLSLQGSVVRLQVIEDLLEGCRVADLEAMQMGQEDPLGEDIILPEHLDSQEEEVNVEGRGNALPLVGVVSPQLGGLDHQNDVVDLGQGMEVDLSDLPLLEGDEHQSVVGVLTQHLVAAQLGLDQLDQLFALLVLGARLLVDVVDLIVFSIFQAILSRSPF